MARNDNAAEPQEAVYVFAGRRYPRIDRDPRVERILTGRVSRPLHRTVGAIRRRVLFLSAAPLSIGHIYRVEHPATALTAAGWQTVIMSADDPRAADRAAAADLVVVFRGRWGKTLARVRERCTAGRIPLVYDIDDLLFDPAATAANWIAFLDGRSPGERQRWIAEAGDYRRALAEADAAILTTPALASAAAKVCPSVHVLPNALDPRMEAAAAAAMHAPKPSTGDGRPRLVFASGTPTHHRDFAVAAKAVASVFARRSESVLVIIGHLDPTIYPELRPFANRIELRPRVKLLRLFAELARCDVNLCPLELRNPFNEAKSAVRWLAAAAVGVPSIVSPTEPLLDAVVDGENGLVADDSAAWTGALDTLLDDPAHCMQLGALARVEALARFGFRPWAAQAAAVYASLLDCHRRESPPGVV